MGGFPTFPSLNPGMRVPSLGNPNASPFDQANNGFEFLRMAGQREVDKVAFQDISLIRLAETGSLNRAEFLDLSAQQNELARLSGKFSADGGIDDMERLRLNTLRNDFQEDLAVYKTGDERPAVGRGVQDRQASFLYEQLATGKLQPDQAIILRMHMSSANFANGADELREPGLPARQANAQDRLASLWAELGS